MTENDFKLIELPKLGWGWSYTNDELHVISYFFEKKEDAEINMKKYQNIFSRQKLESVIHQS